MKVGTLNKFIEVIAYFGGVKSYYTLISLTNCMGLAAVAAFIFLNGTSILLKHTGIYFAEK